MSYFTSVRYGKMRMVARFKTDRDDLRVRDRCVVRTDRGKELGEVLTPLQPIPEAIPAESLWDVHPPRGYPGPGQRRAGWTRRAFRGRSKTCKELIQKLNLQMKVTDVDYVYGGERVIFYFTSETRVDFRELVRLLAHEFRTRIELKQVGARDEARLIGDAGPLRADALLPEPPEGARRHHDGHGQDPEAHGRSVEDHGRCGKLLCCLRYEYTTYTESRDVMPQRGTRLESKKGVGIVVDQNLLLREVTLPAARRRRPLHREARRGDRRAPSVAGCNGCDTPKAGRRAAAATAARSAPGGASGARRRRPDARPRPGRHAAARSSERPTVKLRRRRARAAAAAAAPGAAPGRSTRPQPPKPETAKIDPPSSGRSSRTPRRAPRSSRIRSRCGSSWRRRRRSSRGRRSSRTWAARRSPSSTSTASST
jgi:hypothetical protein